MLSAITIAFAACGIVRPAQPPSLPPSGADAFSMGNADVELRYDYEWQEGFIGAGSDVLPPANTTVKDALARCDADARCRGITYRGDQNATKADVYWKMSDGVSKTAGWSAWVKKAKGGVTPPALIVSVGGTSRLELRLRESFYTVQNLSRSGDQWSFSRPLDDASVLPQAAHLGDLTIRLRNTSNGPWTLYSTIGLGAFAEPIAFDPDSPYAHARRADGGQLLAAQDITKLLASSAPSSAAGTPFPLRVIRSYERSADGAGLIMRFNLSSTAAVPIEIGGLGMAMPESDGNPPAGLPTIVWNDPHVGGEHGFVEFVRVVDDEATLLVTAEEPHTTPLEAWRPMLEDLGKGDSYEWTVASAAWAAEWRTNRQYPYDNMTDALRKTYPPFGTDPATPWPSTDGQKAMPVLAKDGGGAAQPWNPPTSITLPPGGSYVMALRHQLAKGGPRTRDAALLAMGHPVINAVPGYVVPTDLTTASLMIQPPAGISVTSAAADPPVAPYTAVIQLEKKVSAPTDADGFVSFKLSATGYGRVRVTIGLSDGTNAVAHYFIVPPLSKQVSALGSFLADTAWLPRDFVDPFGRSASVMPWDRSACDASGTPCGHVLNDARAYDAGLSDDAGGGNPLCLASKVRAMPTAHEAARIDEYIAATLYGIKTDTAKPPYKSLQIREDEGPNGTVPHDVDGIRMTMFYYAKDLNNHSSGHFPWEYTEADKCHKPFGGPTWCMTENMANATYRGFNYPHQIASYWAMYHVARHTNLPTKQPWQWYLYRAGRTSLKLGTSGVGFMDGTVAREVLEVLLAESAANATAGFNNQTFASIGSTLTKNMHARQQHWARTPYPYGSEFGFDTTGQEEVVVWNLYFGNETVAKATVDHILSYMRNSPTWAYHGGARSWGDIGNNGKYLATYGTGAADRGQMHYRSGLNMIPLIEWYRRHPEEGLFLLEVAMGAIAGQMTNIDPKTGASSMMFHAAMHMLEHDPHTGDYGLGFFGNALESGAYYVNDPALGPLCYLCDLLDGGIYGSAGAAHIVPKDAYRLAVFLEPIGLYMTSECGQIAAVDLPTATQAGAGASAQLSVTFSPSPICDTLRLRLTKTAQKRPGSGFAVAGATLVRGAYQIKPAAGGKGTTVKVTYTASR